MFVVRVDNVEEEIFEEEEYKQGELNAMELQGGIEGVVELCINSVVGLTNPMTMKIRGLIQEKEVVMLVDCGAIQLYIRQTGNLIATSNQRHLQLWGNFGIRNGD